jgi:hypothetical protein
MEPDYNATFVVVISQRAVGAPPRVCVEDVQSVGATNVNASATSPPVSATSTYKPT